MPTISAPAAMMYRLPESSEFERYVPTERDGRERLSSYLVSSLQMQHVLVLAGSGTSVAAGGPKMSDLWRDAVDPDRFPDIANIFNAVGYGTLPDENNIEELLSRCDAFLQLSNNATVTKFLNLTIEMILAACRMPHSTMDGLQSHREFLRKLARRRVRDSRLKVFTTNYDLCFDKAAGALGIVPIDGFSFAHPRRFDPRFFEYDIVRRGSGPETTAYVPGVFLYYKLHGSVDWSNAIQSATEIDPNVTSEHACLIYPAKTKYQLSYQQPHLELMAQYLAALRQPNTCLLVLGFGFNDNHLSEPIYAALETNAHFRLIVVDPYAETNLGSRWGRLASLATSTDTAFVAAPFADFVRMIPDLKALSSAERLEQAVRRVVERS